MATEDIREDPRTPDRAAAGRPRASYFWAWVDRFDTPALRRARGPLLTVAVASVVLLVGLNNGGYQASARGSLAVLGWWTVALAVALAVWPRRRLPQAAIVAGAALAALAAMSLLSGTWSASFGDSYTEFNRVSMYLALFAFVCLSTTRRDAARWCDGLALGIVAIATVALVSRLLPGLIEPTVAPGFLSDENRLSYPVNYWNGLGILTALGLPLLVRAAVSARSAVWRAVSVAPIPLLAATIYLTSSRGGVATAAVGAVAIVVLGSRRPAMLAALAVGAIGSAGAIAVLNARPSIVDGPFETAITNSQGRSAALLIALLCVATGAIYATLARGPVLAPRFGLGRPVKLLLAILMTGALVGGLAAIDPGERFDEFKQRSSETGIESGANFTNAHLLSSGGSGRWQLWGAAVDQFEADPVAGQGAGSFESWWAENKPITLFARDAHSLYLETLGELGLIGFLILVAALGTGLVSGAARLRRTDAEARSIAAALLAVLLGFALAASIDWVWELSVVGLVAIASLALLTGPATASGPSERRRPRALFRYGLPALALILIGCQGVSLLAQAELRDSEDAVRGGDGKAAVDHASRARSLEPWASGPYLQLALIDERARDLRNAGERIGQAIDRDRNNWRLWLVAARIQTKAGLIVEARRSLERAAVLNPMSPLFDSLPGVRRRG